MEVGGEPSRNAGFELKCGQVEPADDSDGESSSRGYGPKID
jgi:hypothetical protein